MRSLDKQRQYSARLAARREADRFWRGHFRVALADDLGPAADDCTLHETEAPECHSTDFADELAGCACTAAAWRFVGQLPLRGTGLLLRHFSIVMP